MIEIIWGMEGQNDMIDEVKRRGGGVFRLRFCYGVGHGGEGGLRYTPIFTILFI